MEEVDREKKGSLYFWEFLKAVPLMQMRPLGSELDTIDLYWMLHVSHLVIIGLTLFDSVSATHGNASRHIWHQDSVFVIFVAS